VDKNGETVIGFYAERSHRIVPTDDCAIHPDWAKKLIAAVKQYAYECRVRGYDELTKKGSLRHLVARELNGKFIVTLVSATDKLPNLEYFCSLLDGIFKEYTLWLNINKTDTNVILGEKFNLIKGEGFFDAEEKGILYSAGPQTFIQVNANVRGKLYDAALNEALKEEREVVIDAYSGGGLLTAMLAKRVEKVYGIELEREAVACADTLKEKNGLQNMTNICGKVEEKIFDALEREQGKKLGLILDPPRAGIHRSVLEALKKSGIPRLVLISCNPATLARDLGILTGNLQEVDGVLVQGDGKGEYEIESIQPYDMFPQTKHVETIVCLRKQ
jgi:23S rRNA (uracil1939-C5)-methyltransferase